MYECGLQLESTPVLQETIDVRVTDDKSTVSLLDVAVLDVDGNETVVVIALNSIRSFYTRNNQTCHSKLSLDGYPWTLTRLKHDQVAVVISNPKQIVTVESTPDLKVLSNINTQKQYLGITSLTPESLAVSSNSPPCVDVIDMSGNVLRSFSPLENGHNMLKYPNFLCTTKKGAILVSDQGAKSVLCLTTQGDVMFNFAPSDRKVLKFPLGITVTNAGDILVADRQLNHVLQLNASGQFVGNILTSQDNLVTPYGLCIDHEVRLYVSQWHDFVKVFLL